jgi:hypothetical protein
MRRAWITLGPGTSQVRKGDLRVRTILDFREALIPKHGIFIRTRLTIRYDEWILMVAIGSR